jgi:hypothetical protein
LLTLDDFPTDEIKIPLPPLQSIIDIRYDNSAGDDVLLDDPIITSTLRKNPGGWFP